MLDKPSDNAERASRPDCAAFLTVLAAADKPELCGEEPASQRNLKSGNISSPSGTFSPLFSA